MQRLFFAASVLAHVALLAVLWVAGPYQVGQQKAREDGFLVQASLEKAQRIQLQRRVAALEAMQRQAQPGAQSGGAPPAGDEPDAPPPDTRALLDKARAATEALEAAERKVRAEELARLLGVPPAQALEKLAREEPALPPPTGSTAQQMAQLEQRAQQAAAHAASRAEQARGGRAVASSGGQGAQRTAGVAGGAGGSGQGGVGAQGGSGRGGGPAAAAPLQGGAGFQDARRYAAQAAPDPATTRGRIANGQTVGAGGGEAARLVLKRWYIAGPFPSRGPADLQRVYPPELGVDLDAVYQGKDGRSLRWRYMDEPGYPLVPQPRVENAVYYAYTEVRVDRAQEVWVDIGADDDSKLWLNDELVWTSGDGDKPWYRQPFYTLDAALAQQALVEGSRRVALKAGRNRLLFKLYNGVDLMFFSVALRP